MIKGKVFSKEGWFCAPSTAFWHPPPNSARIGYPTEGALFISVQLSTIASTLQKIWVLITLWKQLCPSMHIIMRCVHPGEKKKKKKKSSISIEMIMVFVLRLLPPPPQLLTTTPLPNRSEFQAGHIIVLHLQSSTPWWEKSLTWPHLQCAFSSKSNSDCYLLPHRPPPPPTHTHMHMQQTKNSTRTKCTHFWGSGPNQWEFDPHRHQSICGCWGCCGAAAQWRWGSSPPWSLWTGLGSGSPDPGTHSHTGGCKLCSHQNSPSLHAFQEAKIAWSENRAVYRSLFSLLPVCFVLLLWDNVS